AGGGHLRGARARGRPDRARGFGGRVRRVARTRAPDRGARLREGAAGGEEPPRGDGSAPEPERARAAGALSARRVRSRKAKQNRRGREAASSYLSSQNPQQFTSGGRRSSPHPSL